MLGSYRNAEVPASGGLPERPRLNVAASVVGGIQVHLAVLLKVHHSAAGVPRLHIHSHAFTNPARNPKRASPGTRSFSKSSWLTIRRPYLYDRLCRIADELRRRHASFGLRM